MSTLSVNNITPANPGSESYFLAKSWVNFDGTGTVAIRASGNVSSVTDGGLGTYNVNFTSALTDTNYTMVSGSTVANDNTKGTVGYLGGYNIGAGGKATGYCSIRTGPTNQLLSADFYEVSIAFFR